jgi:hypothetical protein
MKNLIIGFSTHKKPTILGSIIKLVEKTEFSHVYVKLYSESLDRQLIYQASGLLVNFVGEEVFYEKNKDIMTFNIPITKEQQTKLLQKAVDNCGKPYGIKDLFGIGLVRLGRLFGIRVKNPMADGSATYICSELASSILVELGFDFSNLDDITPKDLYDKLMGSQWQDTQQISQ